MGQWVNTLRPRQNGRHFADDMLNAIFLNENVWIPIKISLKFVRKGPIDNIPSLVQIMAWRRPGDRPLSEPMMVRLPTHICVTWPQWLMHSNNKVRNGSELWDVYCEYFEENWSRYNGTQLRDHSGYGSANERRCYNVTPSLIGWAISIMNPVKVFCTEFPVNMATRIYNQAASWIMQIEKKNVRTNWT